MAVRLPAKLVEELGLREGDEVTLHPVDGRTLRIERDARVKAAVERLAEIGKSASVPPGFKFDREEANARGPDEA